MLYYKGIKAYFVAGLRRWVIFGDRLKKAGFETVHLIGNIKTIINRIDYWMERGLI